MLRDLLMLDTRKVLTTPLHQYSKYKNYLRKFWRWTADNLNNLVKTIKSQSPTHTLTAKQLTYKEANPIQIHCLLLQLRH